MSFSLFEELSGTYHFGNFSLGGGLLFGPIINPSWSRTSKQSPQLRGASISGKYFLFGTEPGLKMFVGYNLMYSKMWRSDYYNPHPGPATEWNRIDRTSWQHLISVGVNYDVSKFVTLEASYSVGVDFRTEKVKEYGVAMPATQGTVDLNMIKLGIGVNLVGCSRKN